LFSQLVRQREKVKRRRAYDYNKKERKIRLRLDSKANQATLRTKCPEHQNQGGKNQSDNQLVGSNGDLCVQLRGPACGAPNLLGTWEDTWAGTWKGKPQAHGPQMGHNSGKAMHMHHNRAEGKRLRAGRP